MARDESYVKSLASRIAEDIEERYGKPPNFIQLQALIQRFVRNNPDADPEDIDWVSTWDPKLEYTEMVKAFKDRYPMYKWEEEEVYDEERYLSELYNYLLTQARELPEDVRLRLIKDLSLEVGIQPPTKPAPITVEVKPSEAVQVVEKPRKVIVTMELLAKYPLLPQILKFLEGVKMNQISREVVDRALRKIVESIEYGEVKSVTENHYIEILSYPTCVMILTIVGNNWLQRRWALSEAIRLEKQLDIEDDVTFDFIVSKLGFEKITEDIYVDHEMLGAYEYRVPVTRYLKVIGDLLRDPRWKLVNQMVNRGFVYIRSRAEVSRIIREIMKNLLIQKFQKVSPKDVPKDMPPHFWQAVEKVKQLLSEKAPKHMVVQVRGDIPPCIAQIISKIRAGEDVSHVENFTVAAYMVNSGYSIEEVLEIFKDRADYNEKIARYQVEHIAGLRGSRVRYKPPSCSKMKSYGLCVEGGAKCPKNIRNPLNYQLEKSQTQNKEVRDNESR
jgi:DNA primase large subunit